MKHLKFWLSMMLLCIILLLPILTVNAASDTKPAAPTLSVTNIASTGKIKLTWNDVDNAASYKVYRSTSKTGKYSLLKTTTSTALTNSSIDAGDTYYYYVKAISAKGTASNASNTVIRACDLPRPVVTLTNIASSGKIKISWDKIDGAKKYEVWRATSSTGKYSRLITTSGTSITNTSAVAGKNYYYKVRALASDSSANSAYSSAKNRTCDLARPTVTVSNVAYTGKIKVSWKKIDGAAKYEVWRATSSTGKYTRLITTSGTSITNTSAVAGKIYYYKVRALSSNTSAHSAYSSVKYRACDLPRPAVSVSLNSSVKPKLTWNAVSGASKYYIYRSTSSGSGYSKIASTTSKSYTDSKAELGKKYYYKVIAVHSSSSANSAYSTVDSITVKTKNTRFVAQPFTRFYTEPKSSNVSGHYVDLPYMTGVEIVKNVTSGPSGTWTEVKCKSKTYYIWLTPDSDKLTNTMSTYVYKTNTKYQKEIIDFALKIFNEWDTVYVHGQSQGIQNSDGTYGFDCSGFVSFVHNYVMQQHYPEYRLTSNITRLHDTTRICSGVKAIDVDLEDIQPGDVVFFNQDPSDGKPNDHCGIYLGKNEFIHASWSWDKAVCIQPLSGIYGDNPADGGEFTCVRRYLP